MLWQQYPIWLLSGIKKVIHINHLCDHTLILYEKINTNMDDRMLNQLVSFSTIQKGSSY